MWTGDRVLGASPTGRDVLPEAVPGDGSVESLGSLLVPERLAVWSWVLGYTAVLVSLSILRYGLWVAGGGGLGLYEQGLWLLLHRGFHGVSTYTGQPILAQSGSYLLLLLAPLYSIGGVGLLFVLQAFAFGLGYYFIRRIGNDLNVTPQYAHLLGLVYLVYPTILGANLYDFHPQAFGVPLLFALVAALIERRRIESLALLLASFLVGDSVTVVLVGLGVALLLQRRSAWGVIVICTGVVGGYVDLNVVIPWLGHGVSEGWIQAYGNFGPTPGRGLSGLFHHPEYWFNWVNRLRSFEYLAWLLAPLSLLGAIFGRRAVNAWCIPGLALAEANLISPVPALTSPFDQHSVLIVPFLFITLLSAMGANGKPRDRRWIMASVAPALVLLIVFAVQQYHSYWQKAPANASDLEVAVSSVPAFSPIVAEDYILPHMANRPQEWQVDALGTTNMPANTFVILDLSTTSGSGLPGGSGKIKALLADRRQASVVFSRSGVIVLKLLRDQTTAASG